MLFQKNLHIQKINYMDIIYDFIGKLQNKHPEPINYSLKYEINKKVMQRYERLKR